MISTIVSLIFNVLYILIIARVIFSWVNVNPYHPTWGPIYRFVYEATEPLLAPIRNLMPPMGLDFSPIILLLLVRLVGSFVVSLI